MLHPEKIDERYKEKDMDRYAVTKDEKFLYYFLSFKGDEFGFVAEGRGFVTRN